MAEDRPFARDYRRASGQVACAIQAGRRRKSSNFRLGEPITSLVIGLIMIYLAPSARRRPPERTDFEDLRVRNAELERRVTELEVRLAEIGSGEKAET